MAYSHSQGPASTVKYSASHLPGNLAVLPGLENKTSLTFAVVHRNYVSLAHLASGVCTHEQAAYDERDATCFLTQVWCYKNFVCGALYLEIIFSSWIIVQWSYLYNYYTCSIHEY